jgi:hypothetical protein
LGEIIGFSNRENENYDKIMVQGGDLRKRSLSFYYQNDKPGGTMGEPTTLNPGKPEVILARLWCF